MSKGVRFAVSRTIADGKLAEFENVAQAMLAGARTEPGTQSYDWYFSGDRRHCRLLESYVDSGAVLKHLTGPVVQQWVPKLLGVSSLDSLEVYGDPGPKASAMLAGFGATVFSAWQALKT